MTCFGSDNQEAGLGNVQTVTLTNEAAPEMPNPMALNEDEVVIAEVEKNSTDFPDKSGRMQRLPCHVSCLVS